MSLFEIARNTGDKTAGIWRVNPVAKLAASAVLALGLVLTIDPVSPLVVLALLAPLIPFCGVPPLTLAVRLAPIVIAALLAGLTIVLYGTPSGDSHFRFLFMHVTDGSLALGLATGLRILALAIPSVVLFMTIDATDFADALTQILRLPARFVLSALGALRLAGLFLNDWRTLEQARRARGLGDTGRIKRLLSQAFALFVLSIRRGTSLATAMEARGFGSGQARVPARVSRFTAGDARFVGLFAVVTGIAVTAAVLSGQWRWLFA